MEKEYIVQVEDHSGLHKEVVKAKGRKSAIKQVMADHDGNCRVMSVKVVKKRNHNRVNRSWSG